MMFWDNARGQGVQYGILRYDLVILKEDIQIMRKWQLEVLLSIKSDPLSLDYSLELPCA
jgi:aminoglycoside/choline kinase family phosphotransferase